MEPGSEQVPGINRLFTDVQSNYWAAQMIERLSEQNIIAGYPDNTFKPNNNITRAEFTRMLSLALGLEQVTTGSQYKDLISGAWYSDSIAAASHAGLVKGNSNGEFKPNAEITRQEIVVIMARAMQDEPMSFDGQKTLFIDDADIAFWAKAGVIAVSQKELVGGYPDRTFKPNNKATRAEACAVISRYMDDLDTRE